MFAVDSDPVAMMQNWAENRSPRSVVDRPAVRRLVEDGGDHSRLELDAPAQVEPVRDMVGVAEYLRLGGVLLGPLPFLLELFGERVRVVQALDVAAGAGVAVPVPGAADVGGHLEGLQGEPELPQPHDHVHAGEACTDDDDVDSPGEVIVSPFRRLVELVPALHGHRD